MAHTADIPEQRGSPAKHQAIMDAAMRVFLREGFTRASVDTIAAEAGVSKRTIYNHFDDKERLFVSVFRATLDSVTRDFDVALDETLGDSDDLHRDFVALARRWLRLFLREDAAALRRLVLAEAAHHPELIGAWAEAGAMRVNDRVARMLARLTERGKLDVPDPDRAAQQLTLLLTTPAQQISQFGTIRLSDGEVDDIVVPNVEMFLRAYTPR
jgi:TetR/AcrR family transcriptional regulator, mexJK operon transcriptional repressor